MEILLVEDNEIDVRITLRLLHKSYRDVEVHVTRNGQEALDWLTERKKDSKQNGSLLPDVVILDLMMPVLDGQSFIEELKKDKELILIPVIVFTSKNREGTIGQLEGANGHVAKDFGGGDLIREINKVLHL